MNTINYEWVIGRFEGARATQVDNHAHVGIGYYILQQAGAGKAKTIIAAFRRCTDSPRPEHLEPVEDKYKIEKLEKRRKQTMGIIDHGE